MHYQASNTTLESSAKDSMSSVFEQVSKVHISETKKTKTTFDNNVITTSTEESDEQVDPAFMSVKDRMKMFQNFKPPVKKFK